MSFTYVGEWIDNPNMSVTEKRMISDLAYIYQNPKEFRNEHDLLNDGLDLYVIRAGVDRITAFSRMISLAKGEVVLG